MYVTEALHFQSYFELICSLNMNYTVTRLEVAFLMIVCCFEGRVVFKRHCVASWLECKTRQTCIYLYMSATMNGDTVLTPDRRKT